jgi:hypothetical protein
MNARRLEFASMVIMMLGIVALCQPWFLLLHSYSVLIIIIGLVAFNVFSRMGSKPSVANDQADASAGEH